MATVEITADNFKETVEKNDIVLIDYWANWCGPCRAFGPVFEKASEQHGDITFGKVDTEKEQALASAFKIQSIPTLMVFKGGVMIFSQPGMLPEHILSELIDKVRHLDMEEVFKKMEEEKNPRQVN